jgi:hypothetical protein
MFQSKKEQANVELRAISQSMLQMMNEIKTFVTEALSDFEKRIFDKEAEKRDDPQTLSPYLRCTSFDDMCDKYLENFLNFAHSNNDCVLVKIR